MDEHQQQDHRAIPNDVTLKYTSLLQVCMIIQIINYQKSVSWKEDCPISSVVLTPCARLYSFIGQTLAKDVDRKLWFKVAELIDNSFKSIL